MQVVHERCCGLDVYKRTVVACALVAGPGAGPRKEVRTFGTMTDDLLALADWLGERGVTHVAMESTGVFWKPLWNLLEDRFALLLVNAQHVKAVPGRKTDVRDCEWLADLLRHGLLKASFVPDRPARELRELSRCRTSLVTERAAAVNRLQKVFEGANIKLAVRHRRLRPPRRMKRRVLVVLWWAGGRREDELSWCREPAQAVCPGAPGAPRIVARAARPEHAG